METPNRWLSVPRLSWIIFLLAVFLLFASLGFANDVIEMGVQRPLRFALGVLLSGCFAVAYAGTGIWLRGKFWKAFVPLLVLHVACNLWLANSLPEPHRPLQLDANATARLASRLIFDGLVIIASVCLGYAGFAYVSISEGRRHGRAQVEKALLEAEMAAAREVQSVMVPAVLPDIAGYSIESIYRPAAEVGGDFFQVIPLSGGRTLLVIGDVSGKGLRAAMIVSMMIGMLRVIVGYTDEPEEILREVNRKLSGRVQDGFVTCLVSRLDQDGRLLIVNAGHLAPYLNGVEIAISGSLPLGLIEDVEYEKYEIAMNDGDSMIMLTDGVAEAQMKGKLLGFAEVESRLRSGAAAKELAEAAIHHGQTDDITILHLQRRG